MVVGFSSTVISSDALSLSLSVVGVVDFPAFLETSVVVVVKSTGLVSSSGSSPFNLASALIAVFSLPMKPFLVS